MCCGSTDGTEFGVISCNRLSASGNTANIACYNSAVNFVSQDSNGNNLPANICRFGKISKVSISVVKATDYIW